MPPVLAAIPVALATAATAAGTAAATGAGVFGAASLASALGIAGTSWGLAAASAIIAGGEALALGTAEALLAPSQPKSIASPTQLDFAQDPLESRTWAYGTAATAGTVKYWETTGPYNGHLWYVAAVHDTPCDSFVGFYIDHGLVEFDGSGVVTTSKYINEDGAHMWRYDKLGLHDQLAEANMVAASATASAQWTDNHRLLGIAYYVWQLWYNQNIYPDGAPTPLLVLQGRKLWDPRDVGSAITNAASDGTFTTSSAHGFSVGDMVFIRNNPSTFVNQRNVSQLVEFEWEIAAVPSSTTFKLVGFSNLTGLHLASAVGGGTATKMNWGNNGALCLLDYIIGPHIQGVKIGGCGVPLSGINLDTFIAAANTCDEPIDIKAGGTVPRYTVDGFVDALEDKLQVISGMLLSMGCGAAAPCLTVEQGQICLHVGEPEVATITLTDDDLAGAITINPTKSIQDKHNTYDSTYFDYLSNTGMSVVPERSDDSYIAQDGGLTLEANPIYRFTNNLPTAERLDKIGLETEREQLQIDAIWKPKAKRIPLLGTFYWTSDAAGYSAKKMRVMERHHQPDGSIRLIAREENDDKWEWDSSEEMDPPASSDNITTDPTVPKPANVNVSVIAGPALDVTCDDPSDSDLWFHVEYLKHGTSSWLAIPIAAVTYEGVSAVLAAATYDTRSYFVSRATGAQSDYVFVNNVVVS